MFQQCNLYLFTETVEDNCGNNDLLEFGELYIFVALFKSETVEKDQFFTCRKILMSPWYISIYRKSVSCLLVRHMRKYDLM